jgi:hypothetical protein
MLSWKSSFRSVALLAACAAVLRAAPPSGWFLAGSQPKEYDCSVDPGTSYLGQPSSYLKSKPGIETSGFGTMMQSFDAAPFLGKRVRLSGVVKSEQVVNWAGLWMRIDDSVHGTTGQPKMVGFDNMQGRPIKGTTAWQTYSVVLDVPESATGIAMGILLDGAGAVWLSGVKLETVGPEVAVTGGAPGVRPLHDGPVNLGFDK